MSKHFEVKPKKTFNLKPNKELEDNPSSVKKSDNALNNIENNEINFDSIIKQVEPKYVYDSRSEIIVTVDEKTGEQVRNRPLISLGRQFVDYWVSTANNISLPEFQCTWSDPSSGYQLEVTTQVTLQVIPEKEYRLVQFLHGIHNYTAKIIVTIQSWFQRYAAENPTIATQFFEYEKALIDRLNQEGKRFGLQLIIGFAPVRKQLNDGIKEFKLVKHAIPCSIRDNWEVGVISTLAMNLIDARRFTWSNVEDLQAWAIQKLEQVVRNHLIEAQYVDLLLGFPSFERSIKHSMESEANNIGYEIKQLLSIPKLEEFKLLEGFEFNTVTDSQGKAIEPSEYNTKDPRIKIKLNVEVNGKIASLEYSNIQRYLKPGVKILDEMQKTVISTVRTFIHTIDPERFYMHYSSAYDSNKSFEEELTELIEKKLVEQFNVASESLSISILPENTDLSTRFQKLQERPFEVTFSTFSEYVKYTVRLRVIQVHKNGWFRFKANNYSNREEELNDITEILRDNIETYLNRVLDIEFEGLNSTDFEKHIREIVESASKSVIEDFGLVVKFLSLKRHATGSIPRLLKTLETKEKLDDERRKNILELEQGKQIANKNLLQRLWNELDNAIKSGDEELQEELKEKIDQTEKELWREFSLENEEKRRLENKNRNFEGGTTFFLDSGNEE